MKTITMESKQLSVEIEFVLTWDDIAGAEMAFRRKVRKDANLDIYWKLLVLVPPLLGLTAASLIFFFVGGVVATLSAVLSLLALMANYVIYLVLRTKERKALLAARGQVMAKQRWRVLPQGLERNIRSGQWLIPWSSLHRVRVFARCVAIYIDDANVFLIPERAFVSPHQMKVFVELVGQGLQKSRNRASNRPS